MVKIEIRTENVAGDEELIEAMHSITRAYEEHGDTAGLLKFGGEQYAWAINPPKPLIETDGELRGAALAVLENVRQGKLGSGVEVDDSTAGGEALERLARIVGVAA